MSSRSRAASKGVQAIIADRQCVLTEGKSGHWRGLAL